LSDWVTVAGIYAKVADHLVAGRLRRGRRTVATIGRGRPAQPLVDGWIAVSATVASLPRHKRNLGTLRGVHIKFLDIRQRAAFENPSMPATNVRERHSARRGGH